MVVSVQDLRQGLVAKVTPSQRGKLIGRSVSTQARWRSEGVDIPFERDERTGRIYYSAIDVLSEIDGKTKFNSTAQYQHGGCQRMVRAREAKIFINT